MFNFSHFIKNNDLSGYDAIFVVDDDIIMNSKDINKMFNTFMKYKLKLAQPSFDEKSDSRLSEKKLSQCLDKFLYLDFTTEQIKLSKNPFNSARKKGPNWINYHIQDSFEGQRYLTGKIDKFIEDYK